MTQLPGKFVWFELVTRDADKAKAFYGEVVGWKTRPMPMGEVTYDLIVAGDALVGGYAAPASDRAPAHWISYVSVADVDAAARAITEAGGRIVEPPADIPTVGRCARVADPQGAELILFRSNEADAPDQPSRPGEFHWNELWARDGGAALGFYERALGYTHQDMAIGDAAYHVLHGGGGMRGGIWTTPDPTAPAHWLPYIHVDDCDAAVARATRLGATVVAPPVSMAGIGRFAVLTDPSRARFALMTPAAR